MLEDEKKRLDKILNGLDETLHDHEKTENEIKREWERKII